MRAPAPPRISRRGSRPRQTCHRDVLGVHCRRRYPPHPYVLPGSAADRFVWSVVATLAALFGIGAARALVTADRWWRTGGEMLLLGAIVAATLWRRCPGRHVRRGPLKETDQRATCIRHRHLCRRQHAVGRRTGRCLSGWVNGPTDDEIACGCPFMASLRHGATRPRVTNAWVGRPPRPCPGFFPARSAHQRLAGLAPPLHAHAIDRVDSNAGTT